MSVLIRDIKMPRNCMECSFCFNRDAYMWCEVKGDSLLYGQLDKRNEDCPLVEVPDNHGDLIDRDTLKRKAQKVATEAWKMKISASVETTLNQFIDWLDGAPTIIKGS